MEWLTNRWTAVAASILIQSSCGVSYTFNTISVFKDMGANFGILSGFLYTAVTPYDDGLLTSKK
ncbi:nodulin-like/MFS transporter, putative [Medicago truncatula]|uniref:Nodulin-like/MFS transporter, putative n=1 Tax=Medicago truncatula TaxID=3880 RepID=G7IUL2_MEDTR|nr:nodulin-like/MFS transporter, putative [Medicago truncatula]